jgi:hypothetical protein
MRPMKATGVEDVEEVEANIAVDVGHQWRREVWKSRRKRRKKR